MKWFNQAALQNAAEENCGTAQILNQVRFKICVLFYLSLCPPERISQK